MSQNETMPGQMSLFDMLATGGIPVLWLLNNTMVDPPWGKVARITVS